VALSLTGVIRYTVKSCRGESLPSATVEPWGLAGDRRWMVADAAGGPVTARVFPRMVLIRAALLPDGGLRVVAPGQPPLLVPRPAPSAVTVSVWGSDLLADFAGPAAARWFTAAIGTPSQLVYLADPTQRHPSPRFAATTDTVTFADAYPVLLTSESSLAALNALVAAGPNAAEGPLTMARFRPGLVVAGGPAWAEDGWRRLRIGAASFRVVKGCDRCVLTTVDPRTARRGKEPIATLARYRRWDGKVWFGMNLIPDNPGAVVKVGDRVQLLEQVPAPDGPPR
jgi:uncharacterized protein YcbX